MDTDIIWFPGLGNLHFTVKSVVFEIFGIPINWYGIIIATGFLLAVILGMRSSKKFGLDPDNIIDLVLIAAPVSIVCARLYFVIFYPYKPNPYFQNPGDIIKIWEGGLGIYGAIIGAVITAYFFAKRKNIKFLNLTDFGVPYLILAQAIGRWGNFVNREAFGGNTSLPWGMTSTKIKEDIVFFQQSGIDINPDLPVHPTFLYESLWNLAVFFFLIWFRKKKKVDGEVFFLYMILYGAGRFFIEGLRSDSLMLGGFRISQLVALLFIAAFSVLLLKRRRSFKLAAVEGTDGQPSSYSGVLERMKEDEEQDDMTASDDNIESTEGSRFDDGIVKDGNE